MFPFRVHPQMDNDGWTLFLQTSSHLSLGLRTRYLVASGSLDYTDSYGEARYRLLINVTSSTFLVFESGGEGRR